MPVSNTDSEVAVQGSVQHANWSHKAQRRHLWDEPPAELEILKGAPEERGHDWRDPEHLSHNCTTDGSWYVGTSLESWACEDHRACVAF